jgi:hypothetical protein
VAELRGHRASGEAMAGELRPRVEASVVQARDLGALEGRFDPNPVVCDRPNTVDPGGSVAWARLSDESDGPSELCLGGRRFPRIRSIVPARRGPGPSRLAAPRGATVPSPDPTSPLCLSS